MSLADVLLDIGIAADTLARATINGFPREELVIRITNGAIFLERPGEAPIRAGTPGLEPTADDWRRAVTMLIAQPTRALA